jgi:dethiobiotin synthetase
VKVIVVAGTDTGVGKTVVTAALAAAARTSGRRTAVVKPVQTGVGPGEPGDLDEIRRLADVEDLHELARFPEPLAPATAARRAGSAGVDAGVIAGAVQALSGRDIVLVEGAGGLLVRFHESGTILADVAAALDAPVVVVTRAGLGALNHAALTCEALRARDLDCPGLVIGAWPAEPGLAERSNLEDFSPYTGRPVLGRIPEGAPALAPAVFSECARSWINTEELL